MHPRFSLAQGILRNLSDLISGQFESHSYKRDDLRRDAGVKFSPLRPTPHHKNQRQARKTLRAAGRKRRK